jgi:hypothetical protein
MHHERIKYIEICYHFVQDIVSEGWYGEEPYEHAHEASSNCKVQELYNFDIDLWLLYVSFVSLFCCHFGTSLVRLVLALLVIIIFSLVYNHNSLGLSAIYLKMETVIFMTKLF